MIAWKVIAQNGHFRRIYICALFDFSIVFQWRGHDLLSDLRSQNNKIPDMQCVIGHDQIPHAKFRIHCSKTVDAREGQS